MGSKCSNCSNVHSIAVSNNNKNNLQMFVKKSNAKIFPIDNNDDELDNSLLFQALFKLSFALEINEHFEYELIDEIYKYNHGYEIDYKIKKIQHFIQSYIEVYLSKNEIAQLIQYVNLYEHPESSVNRSSIRSICFESTMHSISESTRHSISESSRCSVGVDFETECSLQCPFVSEQPIWIAQNIHQNVLFDEFENQKEHTSQINKPKLKLTNMTSYNFG
jgi:hypothetical protein